MHLLPFWTFPLFVLVIVQHGDSNTIEDGKRRLFSNIKHFYRTSDEAQSEYFNNTTDDALIMTHNAKEMMLGSIDSLDGCMITIPVIGDAAVKKTWMEPVGLEVLQHQDKFLVFKGNIEPFDKSKLGIGQATFVLQPDGHLFCNLKIQGKRFQCQRCSDHSENNSDPSCVILQQVPLKKYGIDDIELTYSDMLRQPNWANWLNERSKKFPNVSVAKNDESNNFQRNPPSSSMQTEPASGETVFDVLLLYTPMVEEKLGGKDQVRALLSSSVADTNMAFENSKLPLHMRVVAWGLVDYVESGNIGKSLENLANPTDGVLDFIADLRDRYKADLVQMITADGTIPDAVEACGAGLMPTFFTPSVGGWEVYSTVYYDCLYDNFSMAHEIGHNFGASHDIKNAVGPSPLYPYAYGYQDPDCKWHTIMAYSCEDSERIPFFSTPFLNEPNDGKPLGINNAADVVRAINNTMRTVAAYR